MKIHNAHTPCEERDSTNVIEADHTGISDRRMSTGDPPLSYRITPDERACHSGIRSASREHRAGDSQMTRLLKTSGFLGLAVTMVIGLYQGYLFSSSIAPPFWIVNGHVHLGVLSILAIVTGVAIDALALDRRVRRVTSGLYLIGQWFLPFTWWVAFGTGNELFMATLFLWGPCLLVAMLLMVWQVATTNAGRAPPHRLPADD